MRGKGIAARPWASLALMGPLLAGCAGALQAAPRALRPPSLASAASLGEAATPQAPATLPLSILQPAGGVNRLIATPGGATLTGTVAFAALSDPFFGDSAATYRVQSMPAAHALITLSSLEEELYAKDGKAIAVTSDAHGAFTLTGLAPADQAVVVNATIAQSHRLSAIVPAGTAAVALDEASTMIAEMARWQLPLSPTAGKKTLGELTAAMITDLSQATASFVTAAAFKPHGTVPVVDALKSGNGIALRNLYVKAFGVGVSAGGATPGDHLSDVWKGILGYRPLSLTTVSFPNGTFRADDAAADAAGNLYVVPHNNFLVFVPAQAHGPLLAYTGQMTPGNYHVIAGQVNGGDGPTNLADYNALYGPREQAAVQNPASAPLVADGFPLFHPFKLVLEPIPGSSAVHVFFTSRQGHRVFLIPGADFVRYGRQFLAGRLYTVAGYGDFQDRGAVVEPDDPNTPDVDETQTAYLLGDGGPAERAALAYPLGMAKDSKGNLYVSDAGYFIAPYKTLDPNATFAYPYDNPKFPGRLMNVYHQSIRFVRASDGAMFTLRLKHEGSAYPLSGAEDLRISETASGNFLYVTDTLKHYVFRVRLPDDLATLATSAPAESEVEPVLGVSGQAGAFDLTVPGAHAPTLATVNDGWPKEQVRLDTPIAIDFDRDGNLLVADTGHLRLLERSALGGPGLCHTLAGAQNAGYTEGDSRLIGIRLRSMNVEPTSGNVLLIDDKNGLLQRLWTGRGTL